MKSSHIPKQPASKGTMVPGKQYSYHEIVEFLDSNWKTNQNDTSLSAIKKLNHALGNVAEKTNVILITGTNGKSLTAHFAAKLLKEDGLNAGIFYSSRIMTYNEQFSVNNESISNKSFTDIGNEVLNAVATTDVEANSLDILTMMALLYFKNAQTDLVVLEVAKHGPANPMNICAPKIIAVTRITDSQEEQAADVITSYAEELLSVVSNNTHVISADQSKLNLQIMQSVSEAKGGVWSMPIRKLAPLQYPFEQLHGRCAALAERIAHIYVNTFLRKDTVMTSNSLLTKQKGQRGRPSLEAKRQAELNPKRTVEQFWKENTNELPGRFQLLDKEKPSILLDNASNLDAFKNILLGVRLLHYQRPLKGLTIVLGCDNPNLELTEFLKLLRYFFKKTSGQVIVCPVTPLPSHKDAVSWNPEKVINDLKAMKIKAKASKSFVEAFELATKSVDERHGLVVITGSSSIITEYWKTKGIKKI
jgi:folylpolyglutamate synthase/dihydrofolate synthase